MHQKSLSVKLRKYLNEHDSLKANNLNKNFWNWFGGSKIVENGQPMICYHGSPKSDISTFDLSKIGHNKGNLGHYGYGIYFSTDRREALTYGDALYECYIKILNPFTGTDKQMILLKKNGITTVDDLSNMSIDFKSFKESFRNDKVVYLFLMNIENHGVEYAWDEIHKLTKVGLDYDKLNDISNMVDFTTLNKNVDGVPDHVIDTMHDLGISPKINQGFAYAQSLHWITDLGNRSREVTNVIKKLGYDGVFYGSELVAFNSNQIKSIKNNGTWGIDSDNIYS